jgi:exosome complex RNA-binding protein Csl4
MQKKRACEETPPTSATLASSDVSPAEGAFLWAGEWRSAVVGNRSKAHQSPLPTVGNLVTCRVTRINPRMASVEILCVGETALREACAGLLRREDVRPNDMERVEVYRSFRPGDIVLARVLSLGDARAYYLSSSEPELGVVLARSSEGAVMKAVSHCLMECPLTKAREPRKVAKPKDAEAVAATAASGHDSAART